jgi:spermidine synthase
VADARRFVRASTQRYDVVIADLFHPARDGAAGLYTREHFQAIRDRLSDGGLFCQWLPLFQLDADGLRMITATFLEVFPEASALLLRLNADTPVIGLIGGQGRHLWSPETLERRLNQPSLREALKPMALAEVLPVMGTWFADTETLKTYSQSVGINTDDHPILLFDAPRTLGPVPPKGQALLSELLDLQRPFPADLCAGRPADECRRFRAYLEARDAHLRGLIAESEGRPEEAEQGFLRSVVLSADFTPGYAQLITRASLRAHSDPNGARRLLNLLIEARPERTVARDLKVRLGL